MGRGPSWETLARKLRKISIGGRPLRAMWSAYVGSENYGIWWLESDGGNTDAARAAFGLLAARAIEKLGISPLSLPKASEYFPHWKEYCKLEEGIARRTGEEIDLSDCVPFGLGKIDFDAIDPSTRAWLELLRRNIGAFRGSGSSTFGGRTYHSLHGRFDDVCEVAAIYCTRLARDEIAKRLDSPSGTSEPEMTPDRKVNGAAVEGDVLSEPAPERARGQFEPPNVGMACGSGSLVTSALDRVASEGTAGDSPPGRVAQQCQELPERHSESSSPPRRQPDLESSRRRIELAARLATELATLKLDLKGYCTADRLKSKHPGFILWEHISREELRELVSGEAFTPKAYADNLVLRTFGLTSRQTLKKDRRKLRTLDRKHPN